MGILLKPSRPWAGNCTWKYVPSATLSTPANRKLWIQQGGLVNSRPDTNGNRDRSPGKSYQDSARSVQIRPCGRGASSLWDTPRSAPGSNTVVGDCGGGNLDGGLHEEPGDRITFTAQISLTPGYDHQAHMTIQTKKPFRGGIARAGPSAGRGPHQALDLRPGDPFSRLQIGGCR